MMVKIFAAFLRSWLRALGFLTRVPIDAKYYQQDRDRRSDAGLYPLVGLAIGCVGAVVLLLADWVGFSSLLVSLLATISIIALTGGLHEDGLSDVADAFFAPKAYDADARLAIMKDSHIGVFGVLALILVTGLRVVALADMVREMGIVAGAQILILAEVVSRTGMVALWPSLPNVSPHSIARTIGAPSWGDAFKTVISGSVILLFLSFLMANFIVAVIVTFLLGLVLWMFRALCRRKIGGLCGDVLGAAQQIGIIVILLACLLAFKVSG